ncbi:surfeit locus protein 2 [Triplophysa rosa]|uniref:Surfeit locus protein 2-like n=1 Tax=Triplophysa rosa TaxID=992332 RepID=A0A9W7X4A2_TRIRA|nr:surfeit locus protein 2 [Triplophysa rosa]KAI7813423.1 putative surfeit locus protein 2-like [Triplophysa rosa]
MEGLSEELRTFLQTHPFLQLTDSKKIKCTLNGHEFPCSLAELQHFTSGKKYKQLSADAQFDYNQYEPHIVSSTKQPNHLFCKLTLRHINRVPQHVLRHVSGKKYKKALEKYEECVRQGVEFVPACLRQKKRPKEHNDVTGSDNRGKRKEDSGIWDPSLSDEEKSDSEDSMSDLYPSSLFTLKPEDDEEGMKNAEEDDFKTDDDEVTEMEVENRMPKRKKAQSGASTKRFKKNKRIKGFRCVGKVKGK